MKITKMNNGFYKLGDDEYRVEAPMKMPNETVLESFGIAGPDGKRPQRYVTVKTGKKLRSSVSAKDEAGNFTEPEPTVWHLYKMIKFERADKKGVMQPKTTLEILDDNFTGTAKEAIAVCEAHKAGG